MNRLQMVSGEQEKKVRALRFSCVAQEWPQGWEHHAHPQECGRNHENVDMAYMAGMVTANT